MQLQAEGQQFYNRRFSFQAKSDALGRLCRSQSSGFVDQPEVKTRLVEAHTTWRPELVPAHAGGSPAGGGSRLKLDRPLSTGDFTFKIKTTTAALLPHFRVDGNAEARVEKIALAGEVASQEPLYHNRGKFPGTNLLNKTNCIQICKVIPPQSCANGVSAENSSGAWVGDCHRYHNLDQSNKISKSGKVGVIFSGTNEDKSYSPDRNRLFSKHSINNGGQTATFRRSRGKNFTLGGVRLPQACGYPFLVSLASGPAALNVVE